MKNVLNGLLQQFKNPQSSEHKIHEEINNSNMCEVQQELIESFKRKNIYYNQINYIKDERLINYYTYLLKAEDEKIGYLQKLLLQTEEQGDIL